MTKLITVFAALLLISPAVLADDTSPELDAATSRGLAFLAAAQNADGSFGAEGKPKVAISALTLMAHLSNGHVPDHGRYGLTVRRTLDWLVNSAPADGYFGNIDGNGMYTQGVVTLALAEAYGVESDPPRRSRLRAVVDHAMDVIAQAQDRERDGPFAGVWRYDPKSTNSDLAVISWNVQALRACQNIGLDVKPDRLERTVAFIDKCYDEKGHGFGFRPGYPATRAATGVGVLSLYLLDRAKAPNAHAAAGARFLAENPVTDASPDPYDDLYYSTQAAFQVGDPLWATVWKTTQSRLLPAQKSDGGWDQSRNGDETSRVRATALSVLTLSIPYRLLPTYQR